LISSYPPNAYNATSETLRASNANPSLEWYRYKTPKKYKSRNNAPRHPTVENKHFESYIQHTPFDNQAHSHCANTHHLALRSASTRPRHVPFSPILITVSQAVPSASLVLVMCSFFRVNRMILPDGVWIASLAGLEPLLSEEPDDVCEGLV
jgi:hypothetical protein